MSLIFQKLIETSDGFIKALQQSGAPVDEGHGFDWPNYVYTSRTYRRAHLDIVDAREQKNLYMMHLCIFPNINDSSPIYGFDLIAGPNKVTGAFHDFSPTLDTNHPMCEWFAKMVHGLEWSKPRQLPDWARNIFSSSMVAAGNIRDANELDFILKLANTTLKYYLENVGKIDNVDSKEAQNYYCQNQKCNPHTPKVMESLGYDKETVEKFIKTCLFPEVQ